MRYCPNCNSRDTERVPDPKKPGDVTAWRYHYKCRACGYTFPPVR